jgi:DNA polymerase-3 subunit delta
MPDYRPPEEVLKSLKKGRLEPVYLFYGPGEFRMEKVVDQIKTLFITEETRELNMEIFYGGEKETEPEKILEHARSLPFFAEHRLIIVRRTEIFSADRLNKFLPYFENPCPSTCLIFISSKTDFTKTFYKTLRSLGWAVNFEELKEQQVIPWLVKTASEMGFTITARAAGYLHDIVGSNTRELYGELEKLSLLFQGKVEIDQVKESVKHSRIYSIFELTNHISSRNKSASMLALNRLLEEDRDSHLGVLGMLNRQIRHLWNAKFLAEKGGGPKDLMGRLRISYKGAEELLKHINLWKVHELEKALELLYQADGRIKSGSRPKPVLEALILSLCGHRKIPSGSPLPKGRTQEVPL